MTSSAEPAPSKPKRRWLQFSLRTLLVLVLLVSVLCGWLRHKVNQSEQERRAVEAILAMGGEVEYEHEQGRKGKPTDPPGPAWLRAILGDYFFADVQTVRYPSGVGDASLVHLDRLRHVGYLDLRGTSVTDEGLAQVIEHDELQGLNLGATSVTDAGIAQLARLRNLQYLEIAHTAITDRAVQAMIQFKQLVWVDLSGTAVSADGYRKVEASLPPDSLIMPWARAPSENERRIVVALERRGVDVLASKIDDQAEFQYAVVLSSLDWKGNVSDLADLLTRLHHLATIAIDGTAVDDELVEVVRGLSNVEHLWVFSTPVTHAQWGRLTGGKSPGEAPGQSNAEGLLNLEGLSLFDVPITDAELGLITEWRNLRTLTLRQAPITDAGLAHLQALTKLEELNLQGTAISGAGLKHIETLTNLTELLLADTQVTSGGLAHLKGLTKLELLDLSGTRITDEGLVHLKQFQNLQRLDLSDTQVTDAGLVHLEGLKKLVVLNLQGTKFGPQGAANLAKLEKALPELEFVWQ